MTREHKENPRLRELAILMDREIEASKATRAPTPMPICRQAFEDFAQHIPCIAWTADADGTVTFFNKRYHEFTGAQGPDYLPRFHPEDAARSAVKWREHAQSACAEPYTNESRVMGADGNYHWVATRAKAVLDKDGAILFWLGSATVLAMHVVEYLSAVA